MDAAAKQQIVERIKQANNILVTVSNNPSVDQMSACIGLTLLLNKMQKHATAVFSGAVPSTLEFLQPEKTIETTTDSLRDFIISLDKSKADKLRYKVEDQVVRIFITPYRTKIGQEDLVFSEGDFNVEVVLALGVQDRTQIDTAITAHGRILHDATVISVNAGNSPATNMGQINWQEPASSSLCEMIVSISEAFGTGLIDTQMATAFLTGIVAETHRFSNDRTSPRVMTMSAQLMAAGANQQLIATKLEQPPVPPKPPAPKPGAKTVPPADSGVLSIPHDERNAPPKTPPLPAQTLPGKVSVGEPGEIRFDEKGNLVSVNKPKVPAPSPPPPPPPPAPKAAPPKQPPAPPPPPPPPPVPVLPPVMPPPPPPPPPMPEPPKIELSPPPLKSEPLPPSSPPSSPPPAPAPQSAVGSRTYLDPGQYQPAMATAFSSITQPTGRPVLGGVDPSRADFGQPEGDLFSTPSPVGNSSPNVDSARSAVASAIQSSPSTPGFNRAEPPNQEINLDIHPETVTPTPANGTPSLQLPVNGSNPPPSPQDKPAPPPGPPPLMPAPGGMPPNAPFKK